MDDIEVLLEFSEDFDPHIEIAAEFVLADFLVKQSLKLPVQVGPKEQTKEKGIVPSLNSQVMRLAGMHENRSSLTGLKKQTFFQPNRLKDPNTLMKKTKLADYFWKHK